MKEQALKALREANYDSFFHLINQINASYDRYEVALEAIAVAQHGKNKELLEQLTCIKLDPWDFEKLFENIILCWLKLGAFERCLITVWQHDGKQLESGKAWYLLAKSLVTVSDFKNAEMAYPYIKERSQQIEIITLLLQRTEHTKDIIAWLSWYEQYANLEQSIAFEVVENPILLIVNSNDFPKICSQLTKMNSTLGKQFLLRKLIFHLTLENQLSQCKQIFDVLPEELDWLTLIADLGRNEKSFSIIKHFDQHEVGNFIPFALKKLINCHFNYADQSLIQLVLESALCTQQYYTLIIQTACQLFLSDEMPRFEVVLGLIKPLNSAEKVVIIDKILSYNLRDSQYEILFEQVDLYDYETNYPHIIAKIPQPIFLSLREIQVKTKVADITNQYQTIKSINESHPDFNQLIHFFNQLIRYKRYPEALELAVKLEASARRNSYLLELLYPVLVQKNFELAATITKYITPNESKQLVENIVKGYQLENYRETLKQLVRLKKKDEFFKFEFLDLILMGVEEIFKREDIYTALNFLVQIGLFALPEEEKANSIHSSVKFEIAKRIISIEAWWKTRERINKLIQRLEVLEVKNFELYLLKAILSTKSFKEALQFVNVMCENALLSSSTALETVTKLMVDYMTATEITTDTIKGLGTLQEPIIQEKITNLLCDNLLGNVSSDALALIAEISDEKLRNGNLVKAICYHLKNNQLSLASMVVQKLSNVQKDLWQTLLNCVEAKEIISLIQLLVKEKLEDRELQISLLKLTIEAKTPSYLLSCMQQINKELASLLNKDMSDDIATRRIYQTEFELLFNVWRNTLVEKGAYEEIVDHLAQFFPIPDYLIFGLDLLYPLKLSIEKLLSTDHIDKAFEALTYLLAEENHLAIDFHSRMIDSLIQKKCTQAIFKYLHLIKQTDNIPWLEQVILNICHYLIEQPFSIDDLLKLLQPYQASKLIQLRIQQYSLELIQADKLDAAQKVIENLIDKRDITYVEKLCDMLLAKDEVVLARNYINAYDILPGTQARLNTSLEKRYLDKLKSWIGSERVENLEQIRKDILKCLKYLKIPNKEKDANHIENSLIVDLRHQLDKAFIAFCSSKYPHQKHKRCYFPLPSELKLNQTIQEKLEEIFKKDIKLPSFAADYPSVFSYLVNIQPLKDNNYLWLRQLFDLSNLAKHQADLPLEPVHDNTVIKMDEFLPKALDGIVEIFLKLFQPQFNISDIQNLCFSRYVKLINPKLSITTLFNNTDTKNTTTTTSPSSQTNSNKNQLTMNI